MNNLIGRLLSPVLRAFAPMMVLRASLLAQELPRPTDASSVHASGVDPDRVLLLGSGPAMGYGVLSHELALPGHLARQISVSTGRGVTVDVVCDSELAMNATVKRLSELNLARYDAIVLTVGVNDALKNTPLRRWRAQVTEVARFVTEHMPTYARTFFIGIQPIRTIKTLDNFAGLFPELHSHSLNREAARVCAEFTAVEFVPFFPDTEAVERYRTSGTYLQWARLISPPIIEVLQRVPRVETVQSTEEARQRALSELKILDTDPEERFDRIAELARKLFGTASAVISFLDTDREWVKASLGFDATEAPRGSLLVEYALKTANTFVVEDARADPRFSHNMFVTAPPYLRFYAGHPIESRGGERIGVISVFDTKPRSFSPTDSRLLRDLAFLVQKELAR